jgi:hypothetical protein
MKFRASVVLTGILATLVLAAAGLFGERWWPREHSARRSEPLDEDHRATEAKPVKPLKTEARERGKIQKANVEEAGRKVMEAWKMLSPADIACIDLEQEIGKLTTTLDAIHSLKNEDRLFAGVAELDNPYAEYGKLLEEYRAGKAKLKSVWDSEAETLRKSIVEKRRRLLEIVESLKRSLTVQREAALNRLTLTKAWGRLGFQDSAKTTPERIAFDEARRNYERIIISGWK